MPKDTFRRNRSAGEGARDNDSTRGRIDSDPGGTVASSTTGDATVNAEERELSPEEEPRSDAHLDEDPDRPGHTTRGKK